MVAVAVVTAFSALARIALCLLHPAIPGLWRWAWASILGAVALGLVALRGQIPLMLSVFVPQVMVCCGYIMAWDGFRRFIGRRPFTPAEMGMFAAPAVVPMALFASFGIGGLNSALNSFLIMLLSGAICREIWRARARLGLASKLTMWAYGANSFFFMLRLGQILTQGEWPLQTDSISSQTFVLPLLWWLCMTVAVTLGMTLMTSERLERELKEQASRDPLTGALNRRAFSLVVEREMARAERQQSPFAVLVMDLDHFKQINDLMGHAAGDTVLCRFVAVAQGALRGGDVFCRFGGEEFLALLPDTGVMAAQRVAERIRAAFAEDREMPKGPLSYTVSIGVAEQARRENFESVLSRADNALYRAKALGRNRTEAAQAGAAAAVAFQPAGL
jgi:diguanylate cyclase (GGDEF)-like protein